mmetsp:Transcript_10318/g.22365  ORF Transcript_10318/g.22365 Transcript_10318/m.22365 type:complete len:833 (-) Transcript_10318:155-2653(-)
MDAFKSLREEVAALLSGSVDNLPSEPLDHELFLWMHDGVYQAGTLIEPARPEQDVTEGTAGNRGYLVEPEILLSPLEGGGLLREVLGGDVQNVRTHKQKFVLNFEADLKMAALLAYEKASAVVVLYDVAGNTGRYVLVEDKDYLVSAQEADLRTPIEELAVTSPEEKARLLSLVSGGTNMLDKAKWIIEYCIPIYKPFSREIIGVFQYRKALASIPGSVELIDSIKMEHLLQEYQRSGVSEFFWLEKLCNAISLATLQVEIFEKEKRTIDEIQKDNFALMNTLHDVIHEGTHQYLSGISLEDRARVSLEKQIPLGVLVNSDLNTMTGDPWLPGRSLTLDDIAMSQFKFPTKRGDRRRKSQLIQTKKNRANSREFTRDILRKRAPKQHRIISPDGEKVENDLACMEDSLHGRSSLPIAGIYITKAIKVLGGSRASVFFVDSAQEQIPIVANDANEEDTGTSSEESETDIIEMASKYRFTRAYSTEVASDEQWFVSLRPESRKEAFSCEEVGTEEDGDRVDSGECYGASLFQTEALTSIKQRKPVLFNGWVSQTVGYDYDSDEAELQADEFQTQIFIIPLFSTDKRNAQPIAILQFEGSPDQELSDIEKKVAQGFANLVATDLRDWIQYKRFSRTMYNLNLFNSTAAVLCTNSEGIYRTVSHVTSLAARTVLCQRVVNLFIKEDLSSQHKVLVEEGRAMAMDDGLAPPTDTFKMALGVQRWEIIEKVLELGKVIAEGSARASMNRIYDTFARPFKTFSMCAVPIKNGDKIVAITLFLNRRQDIPIVERNTRDQSIGYQKYQNNIYMFSEKDVTILEDYANMASFVVSSKHPLDN